MAALFLLALGACLTLPFVPALHEAYRRRDSAPLALADRYREDRRLAPEHVGDADERVADNLLARDPLTVDRLRVRGLAQLAPGSVVRRRLVVGDSAEVGAGSALAGSAEAGDVLWLGPGCAFERLHAPTVCTGAPGACDGPMPSRGANRPLRLPEAAVVAAGRALVRGDLSLPDGTVHDGDLVVLGALVLGEGARVRGSVKARGPLRLGARAAVAGHAFSDASVTLGPDAAVDGAAVAADRLTLETNARVGRPAAPATATAREVVLGADVCVHGTVWARERGWTAP